MGKVWSVRMGADTRAPEDAPFGLCVCEPVLTAARAFSLPAPNRSTDSLFSIFFPRSRDRSNVSTQKNRLLGFGHEARVRDQGL
jgi:hypothetical protein